MRFVILYYQTTFIFAVLERWFIYGIKTGCSVDYLILLRGFIAHSNQQRRQLCHLLKIQ